MTETTETKTPLAKQVYLHFHCTLHGCEHLFVKCPQLQAELFMKNFDVLKNKLSYIHLGETECPLDDLDVEICNRIIRHKNCDKCSDPSQKGPLSYYETDLFNSIMLYSIQDLMKAIQGFTYYNFHVIDKNGKLIDNEFGNFGKTDRSNINYIKLEIDQKEVFSIKVPTLTIAIDFIPCLMDYDRVLSVQLIKKNDINLITTINQLVELLEILENKFPNKGCKGDHSNLKLICSAILQSEK